MEILRNGKFSEVLNAREMKIGLRKSEKDGRNAFTGFESLTGMIGRNGNFEALPSLTRSATTEITDSFPYPQIFNLKNFILVCGETKIYEYDGSSLTLKITASQAGDVWDVIDYYDYFVLVNNAVSIIRNPLTGAYSEDSATANAVCNFNGQALAGSYSGTT